MFSFRPHLNFNTSCFNLLSKFVLASFSGYATLSVQNIPMDSYFCPSLYVVWSKLQELSAVLSGILEKELLFRWVLKVFFKKKRTFHLQCDIIIRSSHVGEIYWTCCPLFRKHSGKVFYRPTVPQLIPRHYSTATTHIFLGLVLCIFYRLHAFLFWPEILTSF